MKFCHAILNLLFYCQLVQAQDYFNNYNQNYQPMQNL